MSVLPGALVPGEELRGRFVVVERIGYGAMGSVYAAEDRERRQLVGLKVLDASGSEEVADLKREFRAAVDIVHPNLVRLHELFCDGVGPRFFTMDLVRGRTLPELQQEGLPERELVAVFRQLAQALSALHASDVLHGDLKPQNFLVTSVGRRVVLFDFGFAQLVRGAGSPASLGATPHYMAPEQLGGGVSSKASDWYSFGAMLFEVLTGRLPLSPSAGRRMRERDEPLHRLCGDLLRLEASERPDAEEVLRRLGGEPDASLGVTEPGRLELLGRGSQLAELSTAFDRARRGGPQVLWISGPSGMGKSALVEHFAEELGRRGVLVLRSRCRERESVGYKAVDGLIDEVVALLAERTLREVRALVPSDLHALSVLFPALSPFEARERPSLPKDPALLRRLAINAFGRLMAALVDGGPLVLWLDDLQWSDAESASLLASLFEPACPIPLLLIGTYRTGSCEGGALRRVMFASGAISRATVRFVDLGPLSHRAAEALALGRLKESPGRRERARRIATEAAGHPLLVAELAHAASASAGVEPAVGVATLSELVTFRLGELTAAARDLMFLLAVAKAPLLRAIACGALGMAPAELESAIDLLRARRLVTTRGVGQRDELEVLHDRIREIIAERIERGRLGQLHLSLARAFERQPGSPLERIASHYQAAGHSREAGPYWLRAGQEAMRGLAFQHAADLFARAIRDGELTAEARSQATLHRGEALALCGQGARAASAFLSAARSHDALQAIELRRRAGEQLLFCGSLDRGLVVMDAVMRQLDLRARPTSSRLLMAIARGRIRVRLRGLQFAVRPDAELERRRLLAVDACWTMAFSLGVVDFLQGAYFQTQHLLFALESGEPGRIMRALVLEATYAAARSGRPTARTNELLSAVSLLARSTADPAMMGREALGRGVVQYLFGDLEGCLRACNRAVDVLTRGHLEPSGELAMAHRFIVGALFHLGELRRLSRLVPTLVKEAEAQGNRFATCYLRSHYSTLAWLVLDDVEQARAQLRVAQKQWKSRRVLAPSAWLVCGEVHIALYEGEVEVADKVLRESWDALTESKLLWVGGLAAHLWFLRALTAVALANAASLRGERGGTRWRSHLLRAKRSLRRLRKTPVQLARVLWHVARAALATEQGAPRCAQLWGEASQACERSRLSVFGAAARVRQLQCTGGSGSGSVGWETIRSQGVANIPALMRLLCGPRPRSLVAASEPKSAQMPRAARELAKATPHSGELRQHALSRRRTACLGRRQTP